MEENLLLTADTEAKSESESEKYTELKSLFQQKRKQGGLEFFNKIAPFVQKLVDEFGRPELEKTQLFNLISGSGAPEDGSFVFTEFDLPGGLIESFIRK